MSTDELLEAVKELGLEIRLGPDDAPSLHGDRAAVMPELLPVLKFHRDEIVRRLKPPPAVECLWPGGFVGEHAFPENGYPAGAGWFRGKGEPRWRPIPGRVNEHGWYHWRGEQSPLQPRGEPGVGPQGGVPS